MVVPMYTSSHLFLVGGGRSPLYPPNKVVIWNEIASKPVAELEFNERVRGLCCRRSWLIVALRRRVVAFKLDESEIMKHGEWDTYDNPRGCLDQLKRLASHNSYRTRIDRHGSRFHAFNFSGKAVGTHPAHSSA
jgi:hypothetical protein